MTSTEHDKSTHIDAHFNTEFVVMKAEKRYAERMSHKPRSFLSVSDLSGPELMEIISEAMDMKKTPQEFSTALKDKSIALLFQKTSTRTRCSFENAAWELGARASYIDWKTSNFVLADLADEIIVMSRFYDMIMARVNDYATLDEMAKHSEVPIINGLCNRMHPCQAIGDYMTLMEYFGMNLKGLKLTYIGDGNNVCRSLVHGATILGVNIKLCSPPEYKLDQETVDASHGQAVFVDDPVEAVSGADVVYTDTWVSMGDEKTAKERLKAFSVYQVNDDLMRHAAGHALFMHCLPAHPGYEVSPEVLRGPRSVVFDEAENRKHAQKSLLAFLNRANAQKSSNIRMVLG